jgi:prepilin-type N-terminal cleavage/methylation domain-containing protein
MSTTPDCRRSARSPAYTLIELLVVLGILAVLIALGSAAVFMVLKSGPSQVERSHWHNTRKLGRPDTRKTPIRILYIGNSYTAVNDLPAMVTALSASAKNQPPVQYDTQFVGGATLELHWQQGTALQKIREGNWDFVVLQEQSLRPILDRPAMQEYARRFAAEIHNQGAVPLFFLSWARQATPGLQGAYNSAYLGVAAGDQGEVAPAGMAWMAALQDNPQRVLYAADGSHPSAVGSYLAACTFYGAIFCQSPEGLTGQINSGQAQVSLSTAEAQSLQRIAWASVKNVKHQLEPAVW